MIKRASKGKSRLNLIVDEKMKIWVKNYALKHNTSITDIVLTAFQSLFEKELDFEKMANGLKWYEIPDSKMKQWAEGYADRHNTSVDVLVNHFFVDLKKEEDGIDVKQI